MRDGHNIIERYAQIWRRQPFTIERERRPLLPAEVLEIDNLLESTHFISNDIRKEWRTIDAASLYLQEDVVDGKNGPAVKFRTVLLPHRAQWLTQFALTRVARRLGALNIALGLALDYLILPFSCERQFPAERGSPVGPEHINGGFTVLGTSRVVVFRYEEFQKVLFHETFHHSAANIHSWSGASQEELRRIFGHSPTMSVSPCEAVVEAWATLLQKTALAIEFGATQNLEAGERKWQQRQTQCLLDRPLSLQKEGTHALSYIVLKEALLRDGAHRFLSLPLPYREADLIDLWKAYGAKAYGAKPQSCKSSKMTWFGDLY